MKNGKHLFVLNKQTFLLAVLYIFSFAMSKNSFTLNDFVFNQMIIWLLNILFL